MVGSHLSTVVSAAMQPVKSSRSTVAITPRRFDIPAFYREAARVLRPGGTIAIWTYDRCFRCVLSKCILDMTRDARFGRLMQVPMLADRDEFCRGTFVDEPAATAALEKLFTERLGPYWDPRMRLAMVDHYRGLLAIRRDAVTFLPNSIHMEPAALSR